MPDSEPAPELLVSPELTTDGDHRVQLVFGGGGAGFPDRYALIN